MFREVSEVLWLVYVCWGLVIRDELVNFEANGAEDGELELTVVVKGGRVFKLVAGVMAMKDGDVKGLDDDGENVDDVETEGADVREEDIDLVDDKVAGLMISVLEIEGDNFEGDTVDDGSLIFVDNWS